eukprot:GHVL01023726.1.p1 GENE.GHVL01023726.1~~GHVL01023726.1.p1  ORF type:complete len:237 (-),score=29.45 GHVL01023726.1:1475-2185(-)
MLSKSYAIPSKAVVDLLRILRSQQSLPSKVETSVSHDIERQLLERPVTEYNAGSIAILCSSLSRTNRLSDEIIKKFDRRVIDIAAESSAHNAVVILQSCGSLNNGAKIALIFRACQLISTLSGRDIAVVLIAAKNSKLRHFRKFLVDAIVEGVCSKIPRMLPNDVAILSKSLVDNGCNESLHRMACQKMGAQFHSTIEESDAISVVNFLQGIQNLAGKQTIIVQKIIDRIEKSSTL